MGVSYDFNCQVWGTVRIKSLTVLAIVLEVAVWDPFTVVVLAFGDSRVGSSLNRDVNSGNLENVFAFASERRVMQ